MSALTLFAACFCTLPALAQGGQSDDSHLDNAVRGDHAKPFAVKLGLLYSPSGAGRQAMSFSGGSATPNTEGEGEVSYDITHANATSRNVLSIYGDYVFVPRRTIHFFEENEFESVATGTVSTTISGYALGLSERYYLGTRGKSKVPYVGLGVGLYHQRKSAVESADIYNKDQINLFGVEHRVFTTESGSHTEVGGKVVLGLEFRNGFLIELNGQRFPVADSIHLGGVGLMIGQRL